MKTLFDETLKTGTMEARGLSLYLDEVYIATVGGPNCPWCLEELHALAKEIAQAWNKEPS